jgi:hypothetical protein
MFVHFFLIHLHAISPISTKFRMVVEDLPDEILYNF